MINRFRPLFVVLIVVGFAACANAQQRGNAQSGKAPPKVGAWWYRGTPQSSSAHPDLTGVWFGGTSADLSKNTLPGQEMILTPYGKERYDTVDHAKDPNTQCLPPGPARMIMMAHPAMIVQRDDVVAILTESQRTFRLIYTDGRDHPDDVYDYPEWMGSSIGHWEGDTLVVDTVSLHPDSLLDNASPHSDQMTVKERIRFISPGVLEDRIVVNDPKALIKPWETVRTYRKASQPNDELREFACAEGLGHSPK
jgi:hypothetical protein